MGSGVSSGVGVEGAGVGSWVGVEVGVGSAVVANAAGSVPGKVSPSIPTLTTPAERVSNRVDDGPNREAKEQEEPL